MKLKIYLIKIFYIKLLYYYMINWKANENLNSQIIIKQEFFR